MGGVGKIVFLENINIENKITEFALAKLVAQSFSGYSVTNMGTLKRSIYNIHLLTQFSYNVRTFICHINTYNVKEEKHKKFNHAYSDFGQNEQASSSPSQTSIIF